MITRICSIEAQINKKYLEEEKALEEEWEQNKGAARKKMFKLLEKKNKELLDEIDELLHCQCSKRP